MSGEKSKMDGQVIISEIQLAQTIGFSIFFRLLINSVRSDFNVFVISNSCYYAISSVLSLLWFFMPFIEFQRIFVDCRLLSLIGFPSCCYHAQNSVNIAYMVLSCVLRLVVFPPFTEFSMIRQYVQNVQRFTRPIYETFCCDFHVFVISNIDFNSPFR